MWARGVECGQPATRGLSGVDAERGSARRHGTVPWGLVVGTRAGPSPVHSVPFKDGRLALASRRRVCTPM